MSAKMYYIIFPSGDRTKIQVHQIAESYELNEYAHASKFTSDESNKNLLVAYAKLLAEKKGLIYVNDDDSISSILD